MNTHPRLLRALALILLLSPLAARATVTAVSSTPASATLAYGAAATLPLSWSVTNDFQSPALISSSQGQFMGGPNGPLLGTVNQTVGQNFTGPGTVIINETLQIPAGISQQAVELGLASVLYIRSFNDGGGAGTGEVTLNIQMPAAPSASVAPALSTVVLGRGGQVTARWSMTTGYQGASQVSSAQGVFRAGSSGPVLGVEPRPLSRAVPGAGNWVLSESISVPPEMVLRAQRLGATQIVYERSFTDGLATAVSGISLQMVGAAGGEFTLHRIALEFEDGAPSGLFPLGAPLRAEADLIFSGAGLLRGRWEIAGPGSTAGQPIFRTLALVRESLAAGGRVRLRSPALPSDAIGFYLLRLRIEAPDIDFELPMLRYVITTDGRPDTGVRLEVVSPPAFSLLGSDTQFRWRPLEGARAYQLEFYPLDRDTLMGRLPDLGGGSAASLPAALSRPLTGVLVPADRTDTGLSVVVRQHLQPGQAYLWRIVAIGADGGLMGDSGMREIRLP